MGVDVRVHNILCKPCSNSAFVQFQQNFCTIGILSVSVSCVLSRVFKFKRFYKLEVLSISGPWTTAADPDVEGYVCVCVYIYIYSYSYVIYNCYGMAPRNEQTSNHRLNIEFFKDQLNS